MKVHPLRFFGLCFLGVCSVGFAVGCNQDLTTEDVSDQQQEVESLTEDIQEIENEKESRVAEAAREEREEIADELQEKREELAEEQKQLAALKERQAFEVDMQAKLASVEMRIDQLKEEADEADGEREVQLRKQIAALQTRHDQMKEKLDELRAASGDGWATIKTTVEDAWKSAEAGMQDVVDEVAPASEASRPEEGDSTTPPAVDPAADPTAEPASPVEPAPAVDASTNDPN